MKFLKNFDNEMFSTAKSLETQWLAGRLSYLFRDNESITSGVTESNTKFQSDSLFLTKSMKRGIIMMISDSFLETVKKMDKVFCCASCIAFGITPIYKK